MCIRDRCGEEATSQLFGVGVFELGAGEEVELEPAAEGVGPVSYTHLRAHETVLDLVCRLLLEKKQDTRMYSTTHAK